MDNKILLQLALANAQSESLTVWRDKTVFVLYNKRRNEFTSVSEDNLETFMKAEPSADNICAFRNGELLK